MTKEEIMRSGKITPEWTLREVAALPGMNIVGPYLISGPRYGKLFIDSGADPAEARYVPNWHIKNMTVVNWDPETVVDGLEYLREAAAKDRLVYRIYPREARREDPTKRSVNIMHFPGGKGSEKKPWIMICAGGGYQEVCNVAEGFPIAKRFTRMGYTCFVLSYRVGIKGLMPAPLEDLAAAIRFVRDNAEKFKVAPERYIVNGYSAGGNLTALWGTDNKGYWHYRLPKPAALFPIYPAVSTPLLGGNISAEPLKTYVEIMFGKNPDKRTISSYDVDKHMSGNYPPCYIVCCRDDLTVPPVNSETLKKKLDELGIPAVLEEHDQGGHGFGVGKGTEAEGWTERALEFVQSL